MPDCQSQAKIARENYLRGENFYFTGDCLQEIVLHILYAYATKHRNGEHVPDSEIERIKKLFNMLSTREKEYVMSNIWVINRSFYDYISEKLSFKIMLEKIHR